MTVSLGAVLARYFPAAYLLRTGIRGGVALAAYLAGYETTAHILAVLAVMSIAGPIEINVAKDVIRVVETRRKPAKKEKTK